LIALIAIALAVVGAVVVEVVVPGRDVYHTGWYNVAIAGLLAVAIGIARKRFTKASTNAARAAIVAIAFGASAAALAGIASGLLAPDNRTIVGAPGQRVRVDDLNGTLDFPLARAGEQLPPVILDRLGRGPLEIGDRSRNAGSFLLRGNPRDVVYVEARDERGGHLTVTQPSGLVFLSPVLLMQQRQTIAGLNVPYDSFAVPAAHRIVKVVLFSPQQAATLRGMEGLAVPAVLFAVDDENDRPIAGAIALDPDGQTVAVGSLRLHATVLTYPAVDVIAVPALAPVAIGALLVLGGAIAKVLVARRRVVAA
jgi:hypothetical protein